MPRRSSLTRMPNQGAVIAVLAFAGMSAAFMQTVLIPIQADLGDLVGASREDAAWIITITLLVAAVCTPISGKLGDMYGKRRIAIALLGMLTAGSLICALSDGLVPMIIGRALQGTGMGVIPLGIAIMRDILHAKRLASGVSVVSATLGVGGAIGLPASALVVEHLDWHPLFWVSACVGLTALALYVLVIPPSTLRTAGRLDVGGVIGLAVGLSGVLLAISKGNEWGWLSAPTLTCLTGGIAVLILWGLYELRHPNPLVDLRVSARGPVLMTNLASIAMGFALFASNIVFPQLLELPVASGGIGLPLLPASLLLMPAGLAMLAMSPIAGRLTRSIGPKPLLIVGALVLACAYLASIMIPANPLAVSLINLVIGIGIGLGYAAMPNLIMRAVPAEETGAANGLNTLMRSLGTASASALIAAVLAQSAAANPVGTPDDDGFRLALAIGLGAALVCTALAALIPRRGSVGDAHPALP